MFTKISFIIFFNGMYTLYSMSIPSMNHIQCSEYADQFREKYTIYDEEKNRHLFENGAEWFGHICE